MGARISRIVTSKVHDNLTLLLLLLAWTHSRFTYGEWDIWCRCSDISKSVCMKNLKLNYWIVRGYIIWALDKRSIQVKNSAFIDKTVYGFWIALSHILSSSNSCLSISIILIFNLNKTISTKSSVFNFITCILVNVKNKPWAARNSIWILVRH